MFYSMGPAGMSSSVTSVRSGSEMSDSDMESSTQSLSSLAQPTVLTAQVFNSLTDRFGLFSFIELELCVLFFAFKCLGLLQCH